MVSKDPESPYVGGRPLKWHAVEVRGPDEFPGAFAAMAQRRVEGVVVLDDGMLIGNAQKGADLTAKNRLPAIGFKEYFDAGGLMAYAVNFPTIWRRAGFFVDKILKGTKPADLRARGLSALTRAVSLCQDCRGRRGPP